MPDLYDLIVMIIVGGLAGWLAGQVVGGSGGIIRNVVVGLIGSIVGAVVFRFLPVNLSFGIPLLGTILHAAVGAIIVLIVARFVAR
jgi:uncharacterized membrane protein YeaQ/YmgE (transglycosylase-associated protein family)